jgi:glutathione S-transferase
LVKIAAHVTGLMDKITIEESDTMDDNDTIRQQNPLGKIPALILDHHVLGDGTLYDGVLYDSRVIVEFLDHLAQDGVLIPTEPSARFDTLRRLALVNGILDASVLVVYESRFRPEEKRVQRFVDHQLGKISRSLDHIGTTIPAYTNAAKPNIGEIGIACCLDYLDLRKPLDWRAHCPDMADWMADFAQSVAGYAETLPPEIDPAPWR